MDETRHLEPAEVAKLLSEGGVGAECCRTLAAHCTVCGERLAEVEALMRRFRHWDAETVWREGPAAEVLFEALLERGKNPEGWASLVESESEYQTWGLAWVALEGAQKLLAEAATRRQAGDLALLAATIAAHLGDSYGPEAVADLKALAHATAAAAGTGAVAETVRQAAAALEAVDQGSGDPAVASDVTDLLELVVRRESR